MGNILVISDVHINDYSHRNPNYRSRLYQTRIVAQNILKVAKENGADTLFIAGDLIHKSVMRPYIMSIVKEFLDILMSYFKTGRIIYGNHDLDSKLPNQDPSDCMLSIMLPKNLIYSDQKIEKIGNSTFAYSNWRQNKIDLSWIPGKVDFLITHATIAYSANDFYKSTILDESKFDLCITGDIHKKAVRDKYVSIGIPQRCSMGDTKECSGVIIDPVSKKWGYVDLNPDDNLLKFEYTKDKTHEGYNKSNNTWYIFQPDKINTPTTGIANRLWAEVDNLINDVIVKEGLQQLHSEVLKKVPLDSEELDLSFSLTKFSCFNWRSIGSLSMTLSPGDRIILHGANGSGKSSILTAIKYAFVECRSLKGFVCNKTAEKNCWTEVEFIYQGHQYVLRRGTGTDNSGKCWGLQIDGIQQPYPNLTAFNSDVASRFPFIQVLEYFYFDEGHCRFLGDMKNEEKPLLIAKLLKLGKIDTYNEVAISILEQIKKSTEAYEYKKLDLVGRLDRLNNQLLSLRKPTKPLEQLEQEREEGYRLQEKANAYLEYQEKVSSRSGRIEYLDREIKDLTNKLGELGQVGTVIAEINSIQQELFDKQGLESNMVNLSSKISEYNKQLNEINTEGNKLYIEYNNLKPDICPTCGQAINTELFENYKKSLAVKLNELVSRKSEVEKNIGICKFSQQDYDRVVKEVKSLTDELSKAIGKKALIVSYLEKRQSLMTELEQLKKETGITKIPEKVIMPANALQIMSSIENEISAWSRIIEINNEMNQIKLDLSVVEQELAKTQADVGNIERYIEVTSPVGEIYTEVLTRVASEFSDNCVQYEASKFTFRKKDHLDLVCYFVNPDGGRVIYDSASSGQKTIMDLHIISKLVEGLGLIVFDEFLKSLDPGNHDEMLNVIRDMNIGVILLVSHHDGISGFQNKTMEISLQNGLTNVQFL